MIHIRAAACLGSRKCYADNLVLPGLAPPETLPYETALTVDGSTCFAAVCDGVGDEPGRTASSAAVKGMNELWSALSESAREAFPLEELGLMLAAAGRRKLTAAGEAYPIWDMPAATLALVVVRGSDFFSLNIGDSPVFLIPNRSKTVRELSVRDNLYWYDLYRNPDSVPDPEAKNGLLAQLGSLTDHALHWNAVRQLAHVAKGTLSRGDSLLVCTDGLDPFLPQGKDYKPNNPGVYQLSRPLRRVLRAKSLTELVKKAAEKSGDNTTAIVLKAE